MKLAYPCTDPSGNTASGCTEYRTFPQSNRTSSRRTCRRWLPRPPRSAANHPAASAQYRGCPSQTPSSTARPPRPAGAAAPSYPPRRRKWDRRTFPLPQSCPETAQTPQSSPHAPAREVPVPATCTAARRPSSRALSL